MLKNPNAKFLGISTAAASLDSPLGRLRARAMAAPRVKRKGPLLEAGGEGLRWIEYSVAEADDAEDMRVVAAANPLAHRGRDARAASPRYRGRAPAVRLLPVGCWIGALATGRRLASLPRHL